LSSYENRLQRSVIIVGITVPVVADKSPGQQHFTGQSQAGAESGGKGEGSHCSRKGEREAETATQARRRPADHQIL